jgi:small subunit ribosomal protein S20
MANHKSAIKKTRRDEKKRMINKRNRTRIRNAIKKIRLLIGEGNIEEAKTLFPKVVSIIDRTVTKGIIHKNSAARYKSRIHKAIKNAS